MNVAEYISSGILEAYALGELSAAERVAVEKNLAQYPQLRIELAEIEAVQEQLMMKGAIAPRASVKQQVLTQLVDKKPQAKVVSISSPVWKFAAAASIVLALISSYLAYEYYGRWKTSEANLTTLIAQNQQMAQNYNVVNQRLDKMHVDMNVMTNPEFDRVVMTSVTGAAGMTAHVYWNEKTREVYLNIKDMKVLAQENQYQLWAMVDGKPVDAGVFDMESTSGLIRMRDMAGAAAFAVTIEPRGGRPVPTMEKLQILGEVKKG